MNALAARRRHPAAIALLLLLGLALVGAAYSLLAPKSAQAAATTGDDIALGKQLYIANCATCHGVNAEGRVDTGGPTLVGVGAAAVDFQMGTGRMPLAGPNVQAPRMNDVRYTEEQIAAIAAYVASLSPGPAIPDEEAASPEGGDVALGGEIFRVNCSMCHNYAGSGGALTRGKYAPSLSGVIPRHIYEAMETGPQNMPVFSDRNLDATDKRDIIAFLKTVESQPSPGGMTLGSLGPVTEGLFAWVFALGLLVACAIWLGKKAA